MKANHNGKPAVPVVNTTVSYGSKILKWKQITTSSNWPSLSKDCFLWFKDTKMKANHNSMHDVGVRNTTVSYGSKILKWKQITTYRRIYIVLWDCFLWFKDTKMKANHNEKLIPNNDDKTVSYGSKILKWKQITTLRHLLS